MTERSDDETESASRLSRLRRRTVLRAVGAGTALSAAGAAAAQEDSEEETETETTETEAETDAGGEESEIDPAYGFAGMADEQPPVEPDHEVELLIRPREDATLPEFFFQPTGLAIEPGDTVRFSATTPHHTVTAYHPAFGYTRRVPEGVPPFSSPVLTQDGYWLYTFEEAGVYDFHCGPHEVYGHAGRIVVGEDTDGFEPVPDPCAAQETETAATETATETGAVVEEETPQTGEGTEAGAQEPEPPRLTAMTVLRDSALDPENILESGPVRWEDVSAESKQLFLEVSGFPPCE